MSRRPNDSNGDSRVTDVYREMADERVPEHLNEQVLRMAAKAGRTPYSVARAWLRPAAWAATIGLSFALVLDVTQLPPATPNDRDVAAPTAAVPRDRDGKDIARLSKSLDSASATGQIEKAPLAEQWRATALPAKVSSAPAPKESEQRGDTDLQRSHSMPSDELGDPTVARQAMNFRDLHTSKVADDLCPSDARSAPQRWYDCIESLRESVPESLLNAELDALHAAFPEFTAPADQ